MFCKIRGPEGPTEKDEILRNFHIAASLEEEEVLEKHGIQNQVVWNTNLQNTQHEYRVVA
jgi:hypothetical protein